MPISLPLPVQDGNVDCALEAIRLHCEADERWLRERDALALEAWVGTVERMARGDTKWGNAVLR